MTGFDTGWKATHFGSVSTENTFLSYTAPVGNRVLVRILDELLFRRNGRVEPVEVPSLVWAGGDAEPATDTSVLVYQYEAIVSLVARPNRANLHAWSIIALHTRSWEEIFAAAGSRHLVYLDPLLVSLVVRFAPGRWDVMFLYASGSACLASVASG